MKALCGFVDNAIPAAQKLGGTHGGFFVIRRRLEDDRFCDQPDQNLGTRDGFDASDAAFLHRPCGHDAKTTEQQGDKKTAE